MERTSAVDGEGERVHRSARVARVRQVAPGRQRAGKRRDQSAIQLPLWRLFQSASLRRDLRGVESGSVQALRRGACAGAATSAARGQTRGTHAGTDQAAIEDSPEARHRAPQVKETPEVEAR